MATWLVSCVLFVMANEPAYATDRITNQAADKGTYTVGGLDGASG
jgi:hypothetical protein